MNTFIPCASALVLLLAWASFAVPPISWRSSSLAWRRPSPTARAMIFDAGLIPGIHGPHLAEYDCSEVLWFLWRVRTELKTDAFRDCEDKAPNDPMIQWSTPVNAPAGPRYYMI